MRNQELASLPDRRGIGVGLAGHGEGFEGEHGGVGETYAPDAPSR